MTGASSIKIIIISSSSISIISISISIIIIIIIIIIINIINQDRGSRGLQSLKSTSIFHDPTHNLKQLENEN